MKIILAALFFSLIFVACKKENNTTEEPTINLEDVIIDVQYTVVACCNFWEDANCDLEDRKDAAKCFLDQEGLAAVELEIVGEGPICNCVSCCNCCTGAVLKLKTTEEDLPELEELGFVLN